ncbi:MAG: PilT/PilU family type 4a pilus ATPase [Candidatus Omnitrophota bacterium]
MTIKEFLKIMSEKNASDMFLRAGGIPRLRIDGRITPIGDESITKRDMEKMADELIITEAQKKRFEKDLEIDFAYSYEGVGRFRIIIFVQRGTPSIVVRYVKDKILTFDELNLPVELFKKMSMEERGIVLVTGPAGSGKSTTVASMIQYINTNVERHIVTIEDPIEFLFADKKSIINQRELGLDVLDYNAALKHFTLQSPDVIFIGLIRDYETMHAAISTAEMGVLLLSTFHTINAIQTVERIINFFPPHLHNEARLQLSEVLKGIISLRLIPRKDAPGRIPACETMVFTPSVSRVIREGKIQELKQFLEQGSMYGMQTFNQSLVKLVKAGKISEEDAKFFSDNKDELSLELRGIKRTT